MKRILPLLLGTLLFDSVSSYAGQVAAMSGTVFTKLSATAGVEKAVEPFTMAIAGALLLLLGLAGRKHTA